MVLSESGDHYEEAIDCLQKWYDRPHLIYQAHVQAIIEVPTLKDSNGKELCHLHDTIIQHLHALKAMVYEPPGHFITSMLELKLHVDANTLLNGTNAARILQQFHISLSYWSSSTCEPKLLNCLSLE